tara:strand:+ start:1923 stop:2585 length:663 start_codon:yes stop_codon:yes gene_type:complete
MHYKVIEQAFTQTELDQFVTYWENNTDKIYHTNSMNKIQDPWDLPIVKEIVKPVLDKHFDTSLKNLGDNLYRHEYPYYPHVDISKSIYPCFNVLIPIAQQNPVEQHFLIYDQWVNQPIGATWLGEWYSKQEGDFDNNKKREYPLGDSVVEGIKGDQILEHLTIQGKEQALFKGLTGVALDFKPGNIIVFDSKHIHATGTMTGGWKMGLTLRFVGDYYEYF